MILLSFAQLWESGFRLEQARSLAERHIKVLAGRWEKEGLVATTLHTRISNLSVFAAWIGKPGMVKRPRDYFPEEVVRRTFVAQENRAWTAHDVDPESVIARAWEIDERLALYLALQHHFGLWVMESIELCPARALVEGGNAIAIYGGTSHGRPRLILLETPEQRAVFEWAREVAAKSRSGRIRWPGLTFKQAQRHFYRLLSGRLAVNKRAMGVTAHGLRSGCAQRHYRRLTGLPTPIEGGALGKIDLATHQAASQLVAKALGQSGTASYYGSYGHALRGTKSTATLPASNASANVAETQSASVADVQPTTQDDETNPTDPASIQERKAP